MNEKDLVYNMEVNKRQENIINKFHNINEIISNDKQIFTTSLDEKNEDLFQQKLKTLIRKEVLDIFSDENNDSVLNSIDKIKQKLIKISEKIQSPFFKFLKVYYEFPDKEINFYYSKFPYIDKKIISSYKFKAKNDYDINSLFQKKGKVNVNRDMIIDWITDYIKIGSFSLLRKYYKTNGKEFTSSPESFYRIIRKFMGIVPFKVWRKYNSNIIIDYDTLQLKRFNLALTKTLCKLIFIILEKNPSIPEKDLTELIKKKIIKKNYDRLIYLLNDIQTKEIINNRINLLRNLVTLKGKELLILTPKKIGFEVSLLKRNINNFKKKKDVKKKISEILIKKPNIIHQKFFNKENQEINKTDTNLKREYNPKNYQENDKEIVRKRKNDYGRIENYTSLKQEYEGSGKITPHLEGSHPKLKIYRDNKQHLFQQTKRLKDKSKINSKDSINMNKCPECNNETTNMSYLIQCTYCGLVIDILFENSSFIFKNSYKGNKMSKQYVSLGERTGYVGGLGSYIDYENSKNLKDLTGKVLHPTKQKLYQRLKKNYAQFLRIKNHETEYRIFNILNKISLYLNLNKNIKNNSAYFYIKIIKNEEKVINNITLIAFCIFHAIREGSYKTPITIHEIVEAFQSFGHRVNPRLIFRDGIRYKHHLNNESISHKNDDYLIKLTNQVIKQKEERIAQKSEDYLAKFVNKVVNYKNLEERMIKKDLSWTKNEYQNKLLNGCNVIFKNLTQWQRGGRKPSILTGAVIFLVDKIMAKKYKYKPVLTQRIVSESIGIPEYSIRDHYVNLLKPLFKEFI